MHYSIAQHCKVFDTFDEVHFRNPGKHHLTRERTNGFWGVESSRSALMNFFGSVADTRISIDRRFAYCDAHTAFITSAGKAKKSR